MSSKPFTIGIMTAGGDCPGLNACIRAVVRSAVASQATVVGIPLGFQGLLNAETIPLDSRSVGGIIHLGGTLLRTTRLPELVKPAVVREAARRLDGLGLDSLIVLGGDGSLRGAWEIAQRARTPIVGVPKTIDNDVGGTDFSIGFDSAVNTAVQAIDKIRDTATSHERMFAVEVMGRERGYLATAVGLAAGAEVILVPEAPLSLAQVAKALRRSAAQGKKSCIIVVAEGWGKGAAALAAKLHRQGGFDVRVTVLGHVQRGGAPTAFDRMLASQLGDHAATLLRQGARGQLVGWENNRLVNHDLAVAWQQLPPFRHDWLKLAHRLAGLW